MSFANSFDTVNPAVKTIRISEEGYIKEVPISSMVGAFSLAVPGAGGFSILQNGAVYSSGSGLANPINIRKIIPGANITVVETPDGLEISGTIGGAGVAALTNAGMDISLIFNPSGVIKTLKAGTNMS